MSFEIELLDDDDVAGHAVMALGRLKAPRAREKPEPFLSHPRTWVRAEARKALAKIEGCRAALTSGG